MESLKDSMSHRDWEIVVESEGILIALPPKETRGQLSAELLDAEQTAFGSAADKSEYHVIVKCPASSPKVELGDLVAFANIDIHVGDPKLGNPLSDSGIRKGPYAQIVLDLAQIRALREAGQEKGFEERTIYFEAVRGTLVAQDAFEAMGFIKTVSQSGGVIVLDVYRWRPDDMMMLMNF